VLYLGLASYVLYLGLAVAVIFLMMPLFSHELDQYLLAAFAAIWRLGSSGSPAGIFGTSRF
jgi:predicted ABC-type exoprotein transport system permease subunit